MSGGLHWYLDEPGCEVLAFAASAATTDARTFNTACRCFGDRADDMRWLAELLERIDSLGCGSFLPSELAEWLGVPGAHVHDRSHAADALADEYRRDAVGLARSVAESMQTARSAA